MSNPTAWLNPFARGPASSSSNAFARPAPPVRAPTPEARLNVFSRPPPTPTPEPKRARGGPAPFATPLSRRLVLHETPSQRVHDEIEDISDGEGSPGDPTASPCTPAGASAALAPPPSRRSSLVSGLKLSEAHWSDVQESSSSKRRGGQFGACVSRAQADQQTKVITARHGILRPSLASADAVRAALADPSLQHLRLRLCRA